MFDKFLSLTLVKYAFRGIQACIAYLILSAGIKMLKKLKKNLFNTLLFVLTALCLVVFTVFAVDFSSIFFIIIGGALGVMLYLIALLKNKAEKSENNERGNK